jgi:N6-L-threonylcarbamoyladenine synthase
VYDVVDEALKKAHLQLDDIDAIAVTRGPGLAGSLVVGVNMAKGLAQASGIPLIGVNHLEGHIYAPWIDETGDSSVPEFPILAMLVSGGHSELDLITDHLTYKRLGGTQDDAAGEAFDKVARLLSLPYPGGPSVQKCAESGDSNSIQFPRAWMPGSWDFSFSGVKTAVLREVRKYEEINGDGTQVVMPTADIAASFQESVVDVLVTKTLKAAEVYGVKSILLAGGVSANKVLRQRVLDLSPLPVYIPPLKYCTDNAAMIAVAGYFRFCAGQRDSMDMDVLPSWRLS